MKWSYGLTTVSERISSGLLGKTLDSLAAAGFPEPRLFVDGLSDFASDSLHWVTQGRRCQVTERETAVRAFGNFALALWELYVREPSAERFALFQDDVLCVKNLRAYLDRCRYPDRGNGSPCNGYWNLYTSPSNTETVPEGARGWVQAPQRGRGALGLVFSRQAVIELLSSRAFVEKPQDPHRGHKSIDGAVLIALEQQGWREFVHVPSLVQHVGQTSTIDKQHGVRDSFPRYEWPERWQSPCWPGESFDALTLCVESGSP